VEPQGRVRSDDACVTPCAVAIVPPHRSNTPNTSYRLIRSVDAIRRPGDSRSDMVVTSRSASNPNGKGRPSPGGAPKAASGAESVPGPAELTAEEAARRVARLFPEVFRRYHWAQRVPGADLPVTRRSLEVLQHLSASGPLTVGEQAEHLGLRRNSVSELLQRLEAKGLVARIRDERDERRVLVWLTDAGRDVVSRVGQILAPDLIADVMATLSPADRATVVRGFELLAKAGADLSQSPGAPETRATGAPPTERTPR
jgi:DNA-binding MarR family transcriptional regulator